MTASPFFLTATMVVMKTPEVLRVFYH